MAKNRRRKKPSTKGHPQPVQAWQLILGVVVIVLLFALWAVMRNYS